jgi:hypothetical protein
MARIEMGMKVKDRITGFVGIVTGRTTYITGCDRIIVQPPIRKDGKVPDSRYVDEPMVEVVGRSRVGEVGKKIPKKRRGGPKDEPVDARDPK